MHKQKITAVIPAYNEERTIGKIINNVRPHVDEIIVVDDGSGDDTFQAAKKSNGHIIVLRHEINLGKGAALKTGCEAAIKLGAEKLVLMDADGQHDPDDIPKLLSKLEKENLDIVFGARETDKNMPFLRAAGNKIITKAVNLLSNLSLVDILSGFRALTSGAYKKIIWQSQDYSVETEMAINAGKRRLKYAQIPIKTIYTDDYKGMDIITGVKILLKLLKFKFQ
jgi:glycosyltransferase involved in cell wall biosynthesis